MQFLIINTKQRLTNDKTHVRITWHSGNHMTDKNKEQDTKPTTWQWKSFCISLIYDSSKAIKKCITFRLYEISYQISNCEYINKMPHFHSTVMFPDNCGVTLEYHLPVGFMKKKPIRIKISAANTVACSSCQIMGQQARMCHCSDQLIRPTTGRLQIYQSDIWVSLGS